MTNFMINYYSIYFSTSTTTTHNTLYYKIFNYLSKSLVSIYPSKKAL